MKIALVFPNYLESFFIIPASSHQPLGLAMIASVLERAGHEVRVFDAMADKLNIHRLASKVKSFDPGMIGITTNVSYGWKAVLTGRWLKRACPGATVVFGGPWATTEHGSILEQKAADIIVRGEGEITVVELAGAIARGDADFASIKGIAFTEAGKVVVTPARELNTRLDDLPFPDWRLFPKSTKYNIGFKGERHFPIMTSRGCPFDCINCSKFIHGYKVRTRSIENVIEEIKHLKREFNANEIVFIDDAFNFDVERAEHLCDEIMKLDFTVHIRCPSIRADRLTTRLAWKLKQAGVYDAAVGVESGNQDIVNAIGKKLDLSRVPKAIRVLKRLNILTTAFFMVGLPGETLKTIIDTKNFIMNLDVDMADVFKITPIPGTKLNDMILERGTINADSQKRMQFFSYDEQTFELDGLPRAVVSHAIQEINRSFYFRVRKLLFFLKHLNLKNWKWYTNAFFLVILRVFGTREAPSPESLKVLARQRGKVAPTKTGV